MSTHPSLAIASVFVACFSTLVWSTAEAQTVRTVVTVHHGGEDHPANLVIDAGIREALNSATDLPINYFAEYLESSREANASVALAEYIRRRHRGRQIDLVIAITGESLRFVQRYRDTLFRGAPVVHAGQVAPTGAERTAGRGIASVVIGDAYVGTVNLALQLHPSTRRVFVIARARNTRSVEAVRTRLAELSRRVTLTYIDEISLSGLLGAVKAVPAGSVVLYVWHEHEEPGNLRHPDAIARLVAQAASVPVYGVADMYIGSGVVGGVVRGTHETGLRVGGLALRILRGESARDIPAEAMPVAPTVDWRQLRRWNIDVSRLPQDARVQFRTPTVWETYSRFLVALSIVFALLLTLITGLLVQRARRRRAEHMIRTREAKLRASYRRIRQLAGQLINAQEVARAEIARDLHDDVCQELVGVSMAVESMKRRSGQIQDPQTQHALSQLEHRALEVIEGVRRLSHDLHPATLRLLGLDSALKAYCVEVEKRHDVQVSFTSKGDLSHLRSDIALCLFRIAQEALRNGAVHGAARRLAVVLTEADGHVELTVADDGRGFDLEAVRRDGNGLGLVSIEERAHAVKGSVHIVTFPKQGTLIRVRVPVPAATAVVAPARIHAAARIPFEKPVKAS
jgi:signal transduction histidine kinase